ncbi:hypothetical protein HAP41_0000044430 [Bradyrhizobium barranii subsp. apii]|uniref:Uncharacterized protein n=1 Tax=Bradyrhizobium barranii subsp. apii TaxID=2819348 RepID=A0A8T5UWF9_9BRAD|nr:hypothetical protein [Bradyrhizobium barranii]UPT87149.1 hypothetical protein HAP41_0000044430 [Bradyrhizobium barranii subsp. apii]UPT96000.1 hypothetical protein J4G48_0044090 [Bradyrhizobium barranii subsp. apii]
MVADLGTIAFEGKPCEQIPAPLQAVPIGSIKLIEKTATAVSRDNFANEAACHLLVIFFRWILAADMDPKVLKIVCLHIKGLDHSGR